VIWARQGKGSEAKKNKGEGRLMQREG